MIKVKLIEKDIREDGDLITFEIENGTLMALPAPVGDDTEMLQVGAMYTLAFVPFLSPTTPTNHETVLTPHDAACADSASDGDIVAAKQPTCEACPAAEACTDVGTDCATPAAEETTTETKEGE